IAPRSRASGRFGASSARDALEAGAATPSHGGAETRCARFPSAPPPLHTPPPPRALAALLHAFAGAPGTLAGTPEPGVRPAALAAEACTWPANSSAQGHGCGATPPVCSRILGLVRLACSTPWPGHSRGTTPRLPAPPDVPRP